MKTSQRGLSLIQGYESCSLVAYQDSKKIWTIAWGRTSGVCQGDTCTQPEADEWLLEDVAEAERDVEAAVTVPLSQNQWDALVSFFYNLGASKVAESTMLKKLNAGDYVHAAHELTRWFETPGSELGLLRRRLAEATLFLTEPME